MKRLTSYLFGLLILISCSNHQKKIENKQKAVQEVTKDSLNVQLPDSKLNSEISEPFQVRDIDKLEFTSGGGKEIENHKKCDS